MSKRMIRIIILSLSLVLLSVPVGVLAHHDSQILHGKVFYDVNQDGILDDVEEDGIFGVSIELLSSGDDNLSTTTDEHGYYEFTIVDAGTYTVVETDPEGYISSTPNVVMIDVDGTNPIPTINFGDVPIDDLGELKGIVYEDTNRNRVFDPGEGEVGIFGVTVTLLDADDTEITSTTSDGDGNYGFIDLLAGTYTIVEVDLEGYASTTPNEVTVNLTPGEILDGIDFGDFIPDEGETTPIDFLIAKFFGIPLLDILELRALEGWGYGNIAKAYFAALLSGETVDTVIQLRSTLYGWGRIWQSLTGFTGLRGYNLGLIVSGREIPAAIQNLLDMCELLETPDQVIEVLSTGANSGSVKKACALAIEVGGDLNTLTDIIAMRQGDEETDPMNWRDIRLKLGLFDEKTIDQASACGFQEEDVVEYVDLIQQYGNGLVSKACRFFQVQQTEELYAVAHIIELLETHSMREVKEILGLLQGGSGNSGGHGPPPCKGNNKDDPGC